MYRPLKKLDGDSLFFINLTALGILPVVSILDYGYIAITSFLFCVMCAFEQAIRSSDNIDFECYKCKKKF